MKNKRKFISILWKILVITLGCTFLIFLFLRQKGTFVEVTYEDAWVNRSELVPLLMISGQSEEKRQDYAEKLHAKLTYGDMQTLLKDLHLSDYLSIPDEHRWNCIPRNEFMDFYDEIREVLDTEQQVHNENLFILNLKKKGESLTIETQNGSFHTSLPEQFFQKNDCLSAYTCAGTLLGIHDKNQTIALQNTYVKEESTDAIKILYQNGTYSFTSGQRESNVAGAVCDLEFQKGTLVKISKKEETITGNLLSIDNDQIEIEGYGSLKRAEKIPIYKTYGTIEEKTSNDIVLGNMDVEYVVGNGKVCAALLKKPAQLKKIRVLLRQNEQTALHSHLFITADVPYSITNGDQTIQKQANELTSAESLDWQNNNGCQRFSLNDRKGHFSFGDVESLGSRAYKGTFEVRHFTDGFALVNVINVEQYLYHVVPSEMPARFGLEALKVQTLCARSYAYIQMSRGDYAMYGAHIDDTVNYQVYNKQDTTPAVRNAVDDTRGQVLAYQGKLIEAYYFSTSCGETDTLAAWNTKNCAYLQKKDVNSQNTSHNLKEENDFRTYIQATDDTAYDRDSSYFRWSGTLDFSQSSDHIKHTITVRSEAAPEAFTFLDTRQQETTWNERNFGSFTGMSVKKRSKSGCIRALKLSFTGGTVIVTSEYNIRVISACGIEKINGQDGQEIEMHELLPSAFFCLDDLGNLTYQIQGGGYGHGIGMSQSAAGKMAEEGMQCEEIISFFYPGVEICAQETILDE